MNKAEVVFNKYASKLKKMKGVLDRWKYLKNPVDKNRPIRDALFGPKLQNPVYKSNKLQDLYWKIVNPLK